MHGDCALWYYSMFKLGECWATLYIIWIIFLYFSHSVIQTSVAIAVTQNKSNSTVQRKCCSKYNQSGLIMVEELLDHEMFWNTRTYFKKTLYPMRYHCFTKFEIMPTSMVTNTQTRKQLKRTTEIIQLWSGINICLNVSGTDFFYFIIMKTGRVK